MAFIRPPSADRRPPPAQLSSSRAAAGGGGSSRGLVSAAYRDGGRRQFIERPVPAATDQSPAPVLAWAQHMGVSPADYRRRFGAAR